MKYTLGYVITSLVLIYALIAYIKYKRKTFDVLNKVRDGNPLSQKEQEIWNQYKQHLTNLQSISEQSKLDEIERKMNNGKNILIGTTVVGTVATVGLTIFAPYLAPVASAIIMGGGEYWANNQMK